jgi:hypothetical protein
MGLMLRIMAVLVAKLGRAGIVRNGAEMQFGMGVAADQGQRQQHDKAS